MVGGKFVKDWEAARDLACKQILMDLDGILRDALKVFIKPSIGTIQSSTVEAEF